MCEHTQLSSICFDVQIYTLLSQAPNAYAYVYAHDSLAPFYSCFQN